MDYPQIQGDFQELNNFSTSGRTFYADAEEGADSGDDEGRPRGSLGSDEHKDKARQLLDAADELAAMAEKYKGAADELGLID